MSGSQNIRTFNNRVKDLLIREIQGKTLLEIGVGRAGDLHKWVNHGIPKVRGIDISPTSLEEARRRTQEKEKEIFRRLDYRYVLSDSEIPPGETFQAVSCQFAMHYFFESWEKIDELMGIVTRRLEPGGLFLCTAFDADRIQVPFENEFLTIEPTECTNKILVCLRDTLYFGKDKSIPEYRVYPETLYAACNEHGLEVLRTIPFREFAPMIKIHARLAPEEKKVCFLYNAYIIRKKLPNS